MIPADLGPTQRIEQLVDIADRAERCALEAAEAAERAASRSPAQQAQRLEDRMHAVHAEAMEAAQYAKLASEATANAEERQVSYFAGSAVDKAELAQLTARVNVTAAALREELKALTQDDNQAHHEEWIAQLLAEAEAALTRVTGMDEASRDRLALDRYKAEEAVPELGWWPAIAKDLTHAQQGRLWLDGQGQPRLLPKGTDVTSATGRPVRAQRIALLRDAGYLKTGTDRETETLLHPTAMGRKALYLVTLYPEGLHANEQTAHEARAQKSRRSWMNNEERRNAARRLPPLEGLARKSTAPPMLLAAGEVAQPSPEEATRHADIGQLAQRFRAWTALVGNEPSTASASPSVAVPKTRQQNGSRGQGDVGRQTPPNPGTAAPGKEGASTDSDLGPKAATKQSPQPATVWAEHDRPTVNPGENSMSLPSETTHLHAVGADAQLSVNEQDAVAVSAETAEEGNPGAVNSDQDAPPVDLLSSEAVQARTQAIEYAPKGARQPKGAPVKAYEGPGARAGEFRCGGVRYALTRRPANSRDLWGEDLPITVYVYGQNAARPDQADICGHAHSMADGKKVIRMFARELQQAAERTEVPASSDAAPVAPETASEDGEPVEPPTSVRVGGGAVAVAPEDGDAADAPPVPGDPAPVETWEFRPVAPLRDDVKPWNWDVTVPGAIGEYSISHDCQGKNARGIEWRAVWFLETTDESDPTGAARRYIYGLGRGVGRQSALDRITEHLRAGGGAQTSAMDAARRMRFESGEWVLPEVGDSEQIIFNADSSWTITAATGNAYTVTTVDGTLKADSTHHDPLQVWDHDGRFVGETDKKYEKRWPQMLEILRADAQEAANVRNQSTSTLPTQDQEPVGPGVQAEGFEPSGRPRDVPCDPDGRLRPDIREGVLVLQDFAEQETARRVTRVYRLGNWVAECEGAGAQSIDGLVTVTEQEIDAAREAGRIVEANGHQGRLARALAGGKRGQFRVQCSCEQTGGLEVCRSGRKIAWCYTLDAARAVWVWHVTGQEGTAPGPDAPAPDVMPGHERPAARPTLKTPTPATGAPPEPTSPNTQAPATTTPAESGVAPTTPSSAEPGGDPTNPTSSTPHPPGGRPDAAPLPEHAPRALEELRAYYRQRSERASNSVERRAWQRLASDPSLDVMPGGLIRFGSPRYWRLAPSGAGRPLDPTADSLTFASKTEAKAFAQHLADETGANGAPLPWAATDFTTAADAWRSVRGEPLELALARLRVEFDRSRDRDPHYIAAGTYELYEELGAARGDAPHGHLWPDEIPDHTWIQLSSRSRHRARDVLVTSTTALPSGAVELTLEGGERVLVPRNEAHPTAQPTDVTQADGRIIGHRVTSELLQPGHWIQIDATVGYHREPELPELQYGQPYQLRGRIRELTTTDDGHLQASMEAVAAATGDAWANHIPERQRSSSTELAVIWTLDQRTVQITVDQAQFDAMTDTPLSVKEHTDANKTRKPAPDDLVLMARTIDQAATLLIATDPAYPQYDRLQPLTTALPALRRDLDRAITTPDFPLLLATTRSLAQQLGDVCNSIDAYTPPGLEPLFGATHHLRSLLLHQRTDQLQRTLSEAALTWAAPSPLAGMSDDELFDTLEEWDHGAPREQWPREEENWSPQPDTVTNSARIIVIHDDKPGARSRVQGLAEHDLAAAEVLRTASFRPITGSHGIHWDTDARTAPGDRRALAEQAMTALRALGRTVALRSVQQPTTANTPPAPAPTMDQAPPMPAEPELPPGHPSASTAAEQGDETQETPQQRAARLRREADYKRRRADNLADRADSESERASSMYGRFARGQPILPGHHSEKSARRDRDRADNATRRALETRENAKSADWKARGAENKADMAERLAARTRPWQPADFQKGDIVEVRTFQAHTDVYRVLRVNKKTLTLFGGGGGMDDPLREYDRILSRTRDGITINDPSELDAGPSNLRRPPDAPNEATAADSTPTGVAQPPADHLQAALQQSSIPSNEATDELHPTPLQHADLRRSLLQLLDDPEPPTTPTEYGTVDNTPLYVRAAHSPRHGTVVRFGFDPTTPQAVAQFTRADLEGATEGQVRSALLAHRPLPPEQLRQDFIRFLDNPAAASTPRQHGTIGSLPLYLAVTQHPDRGRILRFGFDPHQPAEAHFTLADLQSASNEDVALALQGHRAEAARTVATTRRAHRALQLTRSAARSRQSVPLPVAHEQQPQHTASTAGVGRDSIT
ncbi:DUF3560 domain-containing protein [Streptomyces sp. NBC_00470]|uniref:DUF3560 domain-containing protein n=1 Tax=Streptomyces sp. NBC_00470 TaxID=2975753 RepID=UPI002F90F03F